MSRIAGHQFEGIGEDRRCVGCDKRWDWVQTAPEDAIDDAEAEYAHSGRLNRTEWEEIQQEKVRLDSLMRAVRELSGG